jgi:uroporphyrinogen decarboxylase
MGKQGEWTPRKRVFTALNHKEPDRVPINFAGSCQTTVLECPPDGKLCTKLYEHLRIRDYKKPVVSAVGNIVLNMDERVMNRFGNDFRVVLPNGGEVIIEEDGSKRILGLSCGIRSKKVGYYDDIYGFPLKECTSIKEMEEYPFWPENDDFKRLAIGKIDEVKNLREEDEFVIIDDSYKPFPVLMYAYLCGYERWLTDMKLNPDFYFALSDRLFEIGLEMVEHWLGPIGQYVDIVGTFDDLGTQNGPLFSRQDYIKFIKPYEKRMIEQIKKYTDAKIYRHCCGSIYEFIPDLIEIGVDILNPVQPLARDMDLKRLKKEFGKDIVFFGGVDIQQLLYKPVEEVKLGVRDAIHSLGSGGGYILGPSHNIEPDTPVENVVAMYEAALEYGQYPLRETSKPVYK